MDKRFKKEDNLSRLRSSKKTHSPVPEKSFQAKKIKDIVSLPLEHISQTYTKIQSRNVLRNTLLLGLSLFILLFCAGWAIPRVFSLHIDLGTILKNFIPGSISNIVPTATDTTKAEDADILILGRGGNENDAPDLTDSIIYGHYNASEPASFTTLSIPRDLYVKSRILGRVKINEVYSGVKNSVGEDDAFDHILETVSDITGRQIKYYAMIDFSGFRKLIDQVGGIDIDVPERLYDNEYPTKNWGYTIVDIPAGLQHFDGDKALKYSRSRHTTSDFDRSRRQQLVITALREKMLTLDVLTSPKKIEGIFDIIKTSVKTNIPLSQMFGMAKDFSKIQKENIVGHALDNTCFDVLRLCHPGGLLYTPDRELFGGASVVIPKNATAGNLSHYEQIRLFVQIFTTYPTILEELPVAVVNAAGRTNLALSIALKLRSIGFPVDDSQIRNQKEKSEKTFIRYNSTIIKPDNVLITALVSVFGFELREANIDERLAMTSPYELVLGLDTKLYFK